MKPLDSGGCPAPMTPPDCDLRGYDWMPLFGLRLFGSDFELRATDAEFRAAVRLWWAAWQQCPAASLPDDDRALAMLAGYGRDVTSWQQAREEALHGFVLCRDGRLYHPLLAGEAVDAFEGRRAARDRKREERKRKLEAGQQRQCEAGAAPLPLAGECASSGRHADSPHDVTRTSAPTGTATTTGEVEEMPSASLAPRARREREPDGFEAWWMAYPRKVGRDAARKAYAAALKRGASEGDLAAGLARASWPEEARFIPHASTWLNQGRWQDEAPAVPTNHTLRTGGSPRFRDGFAALAFEEATRAHEGMADPSRHDDGADDDGGGREGAGHGLPALPHR